jgi:hypothetical protein
MVKYEGGKGEIAEEVLAEYFRAAGFFALRGVPFRHEGADLTDLDVWLYEKGAGVSRRRFIVDSKNKKTPKVVERIFWTSGLRDALELDGAFVASTGPREETLKIARRVGITIIDIQALNRGAGTEALLSPTRLHKEEMDRRLAEIDKEQESRSWRTTRDDFHSSVLTGFGGGSANVALRSAHFYAENTLSSAPASKTRELALRMFYLATSLAAIALDYVVAQSAFQPIEQRKADLEDVLRFGTDPRESKKRLSLALELIRSYLPNGTATANQLRSKIDGASRVIPADILSEVAVRMTTKGHLFEAARVLERAAHERTLAGLSGLSTDARSFASAVIDFCGLDRVKMSNAWSSPEMETERSMTSKSVQTGSLFDRKENGSES